MIKTLKISGVTKADLTTSNNRERYAWVKNNTGGNVYVSALDSTCTAGADNVAEIAAGDVRMVDTLSLGYLWISGNGAVEIQLSDSVNCPFKLSQKGGDISTEGDSVQLGGLQGGVPFSEVTVRGKNLVTIPQKITIRGNATDGHWIGESETGISYIVPLTHDTVYTFSNYNIGDIIRIVLFRSYPTGTADKDTKILVHTETNVEQYSELTFDSENYNYAVIGVNKSAAEYVPQIQLEYGDTATEYVPPITGQELTITVNDTDYTITPDSNPYTVPTEIYQQDGINTVYVTGEGEPTLSVKGVKTNAAVKRIWDKLNELTTAIIVSNGEI